MPLERTASQNLLDRVIQLYQQGSIEADGENVDLIKDYFERNPQKVADLKQKVEGLEDPRVRTYVTNQVEEARNRIAYDNFARVKFNYNPDDEAVNNMRKRFKSADELKRKLGIISPDKTA